MRYLIGFYLFFICNLSALTVQDFITTAKDGDYFVTQQGKSYSLILIKEISENRLFLEVIDVSKDKKPLLWKPWIEKHAPGNSSWVFYSIDLSTHKILSSFSYTKECFLSVDENSFLLPRIFSLTLFPIPDQERKKIGPAPLAGEEDHRSFWYPQVKQEGKPFILTFLPLKAIWPKDGSDLSNKRIDFYFDNERKIAFPLWIEIATEGKNFSIQTIDFGNHLISPKNLPLIKN